MVLSKKKIIRSLILFLFSGILFYLTFMFSTRLYVFGLKDQLLLCMVIGSVVSAIPLTFSASNIIGYLRSEYVQGSGGYMIESYDVFTPPDDKGRKVITDAYLVKEGKRLHISYRQGLRKFSSELYDILLSEIGSSLGRSDYGLFLSSADYWLFVYEELGVRGADGNWV